MEKSELEAVIEAVLFASGEPITMKRLQEVLEGVEKADLKKALDALMESYQSGHRGLQIIEIAHGYQIVTRHQFAPFLKRLETIKTSSKLSKPALEALAVIAYKQPVTRGEVEAIRGVDSSNVLRTLQDRKIAKVVGRGEGLGRPLLYGTTREFLQCFGLKNLSELPELKELNEISETPPEYAPVSEPVENTIQ
jgi:segregation and condensation protein B